MSRTLLILALAVFGVAALVPLAHMLGAITTADLARLAEPRTLSLLGRTIALGLGTAGLAFALGLPFGFLVARTDVPGARALRAAGLLPLLLPPLFLAMTWSELSALRGPLATVLVLGLATFPLVALFTARAFERIDGRREEAALLVGGLRAVLAMELPLVLPAALAGACFAFTFAVNDFAVPDYVSAMGVKFNVYADEVFANWNQSQSPGLAVATALPLIALSLAALLPALALRRRGSLRGGSTLATVGGDFRAPKRLALGPWRWVALAGCLTLLALSAGVPLVRMVWEAAEGPRLWGAAPTAPFLSRVGELGGALAAAFSNALELARADLATSLVCAAVAATLALPLAVVLGHAAQRTRHRVFGLGLELLVLLPLAAPAVLFGIGSVVTWSGTGAFYDGRGVYIALLLGRYAAFAVLIAASGVAALAPSLEEAAALAGARPARRLTSIVAPGIAPSLVGGWICVFVFSMREIDAAILLPAANGTVVFRIFNGVHFGRDSYVFALCLLLVFALCLPGLVWSLVLRRRVEVLP